MTSPISDVTLEGILPYSAVMRPESTSARNPVVVTPNSRVGKNNSRVAIPRGVSNVQISTTFPESFRVYYSSPTGDLVKVDERSGGIVK